MTHSSTVNIGLIQMAMSEDRQANFDKTAAAIADLAGRGANIVSVSELFLAPYFCQTKNDDFFKLAEPIPGPGTDALAKLAKDAGVVLVGSLYEQAGDIRYNSAVVFDADGTFLGKYRKMHIPDDPEHGYDEAYYFEPGDMGVQVFKTAYGTIAPMICWDQWFPEGARIAASKGAQILLYPTAIGWNDIDPQSVRDAEHEAWQVMHRSHSIANNIFTVAVNRTGREAGLQFWGTSFVSDPYGRVLQKASIDREENLLVSCDLRTIESMRRDWPFLDARRYRVSDAQ